MASIGKSHCEVVKSGGHTDVNASHFGNALGQYAQDRSVSFGLRRTRQPRESGWFFGELTGITDLHIVAAIYRVHRRRIDDPEFDVYNSIVSCWEDNIAYRHRHALRCGS